jgi:hypothetical protein
MSDIIIFFAALFGLVILGVLMYKYLNGDFSKKEAMRISRISKISVKKHLIKLTSPT